MKKLFYLIFAAVLTGILLFGSCEKVVYPPVEIVLPDTVSYSLDIQPIWDNKCVTCHNGGRDPDLRPENSYVSLIDGGYVNVDEPEESKLMKKLYGSHDSRATETEKQLILLWIDEEAKDN
jgi:hypothetical protein